MRTLAVWCFLTVLVCVIFVGVGSAQVLPLREDMQKETDLYSNFDNKRRHRFWGTPHDPYSAQISHSNKIQSNTGNVHIDWVNHYGSGHAPTFDRPEDLTVDSSGNVYITGYGCKLPFGVDYFTVKYDSSGRQVWTTRYNGEANGDDFASAICVDFFGNVYVTGSSIGLNTGFDYATVKYDSAGVEQWVARYNGPGIDWNWDQAKDVAVDNAGNVYVTGRSWGSSTDYDYATVKYNPNGIQQWVARYNGPAHWWDASDEAIALVVDGQSNVYVTGTSYGLDTDDDYSTIKYDSDGVQLWVARFDNNRNSELAKALTIDDSGNIYVTGESWFDYATVKYNSQGIQEWVAYYITPRFLWNRAYALAVDASGNVYVTGESRGSETSSDYATIKYDSSGVQQWVAKYNGPENSLDYAYDLIVDTFGNVYVTGESVGLDKMYDYATIKYNSEGAQQWVLRYNGPGNGNDHATAMAMDEWGNIYVTGKSWDPVTASDYVTVKYDSKGIQLWAVRDSGPGNSLDYAYKLVIDKSGDVYVTGYSECLSTGRDYTTVKYNSKGTQEWVARYNGPANGDDSPIAMAVDDSANVYVTGSSIGSYGWSDYATVKYNSTGVEQWVARYVGSGYYATTPKDLVLDNSGSVYVTGRVYYVDTDFDYATVKYNSDGVQEWVARYNGPENADDEAIALCVDDWNNIYVTGKSRGTDKSSDYATVKYNPDGVQQWVTRFNGGEENWDEPKALCADDSGNVYVAGFSRDWVTGHKRIIVKYNVNGIQEWVARYSGPYSARINAIAVDDLGNVYATGPGDFAYITAKYNSNGLQQWVVVYDAQGYYGVHPNALVLDGTGSVYVTGMAWRDFVTVKYNPDGVEQWVARFDGPGKDIDSANAIAVDGSNNVYVVGYSTSGTIYGMWSVYSTIKYIQTPLKGDANNDGCVNIVDVLVVANHISGVQILDRDAIQRADCNTDGQIDFYDLLGIVNVILGIGECGP